ncbi:MAG: hypothetical protein A2076_15775 [Geobacteraceae bacterium GWC2_53_11]|nr:MAG: hypothetical protein A2076_15775 [Geobacteraceae bacterium GWC2_53_11]
MKAAPGNYIIRTVSRALDLLEQFQKSDTELGITDLSNRLHLEKNNVFRLVVTLKAKNYIEMNASTGKYRLGMQTRALGHVATRQFHFENQARPFLNELKQQCNEACYFSVIQGDYTYYLDGVDTDLPVRVAQRAGGSRPVYCTAAGKVLLAFMNSQKRQELLSGLELKRVTDRTITDISLLNMELAAVAKKGHAVENQEHDAGVMEVAAPVFDSYGELVGALSILGPEIRLAGSRLERELIPLVCLSASRLSTALGYSLAGKVFPAISTPPPKPQRKVRKIPTKPASFNGLTAC